MMSIGESATVPTESDLASILECSRDLIIRYDRDIRILFFNSAAVRIYRELLGVDLRLGLCTYELFAPESRAYWDVINARVLGGEAFTEECMLPDKSGIPHTYEIDYHPTRQGGEIVGFTTFARDVTAARAHEAALREKHKLESVGVLAGGIAHDFNNLLAAVLSNIGLAQRSLPATAPAASYLSGAEEAVLRAAELTRQMLAYAGRAPAAMQPVELAELVQQMVKLLRASIPRNVEIAVEFDGDPAWVHGDVAQLQQVVMNLVTNGSDAVRQRSGLVRVSVTRQLIRNRHKGEGGLSVEPGHYVALTVEDDGSGIEEQVRSLMFDPFFSTKAGGRGLGLSAMLGILRNHRASIEVSSEVGRGARFRVLVPESPAPVVAETPLPKASDVELSGLVLLADDEATVLATTRQLLEELGFDVVSARDGLEACKHADKLLDDLRLAVLDLNMPTMGGLEVVKALRLRRPDLPIVLMSGFASSEAASIRDRRTHFLGKPFRLPDLKALLEVALDHRTAP